MSTGAPDPGDRVALVGRVGAALAVVVAQRTLGFLSHGAVLVADPSSPTPAVLAFVDRSLFVVIAMTIADGHITDLHARGRPAELACIE